MKNKFYILLFVFVIAKTSSFAQLSNYTYFSPLSKVEKETWSEIRLTPEQMAKSQSNLKDFRLYAITKTDTTEVPYYFEWLGYNVTENQVPFNILPSNQNDKSFSYINIKLNEKTFVNKIKLDVSEQNFEKTVRVLGSNDNEQWQTIIDKTRIAAHYDELESYNYSTIFLNTGSFLYYRLIFFNENSPAITVAKTHIITTVESPGIYENLKDFNYTVAENKINKTSEVLITFNNEYYVNQLQIIPEKKQNDFHRNFNLYYLVGKVEQRSASSKEYFAMLDAGIVSSSKQNFMECYNNKTQKLKLEILNNNNQPIKIDSIKILHEAARLVTKLPANTNVFLAYGKKKDLAPVYDLIHFKNNVPEKLSKAKVTAEYKREQIEEIIKPLIESKNWLWVIMLVVIAIIGFFSIKLLRKSN